LSKKQEFIGKSRKAIPVRIIKEMASSLFAA